MRWQHTMVNKSHRMALAFTGWREKHTCVGAALHRGKTTLIFVLLLTQGRIDATAVTDFLRDCIARRYYAGAGSSPSGLHARGPPPPRAGSNPSTPPFSGFHETLHEHLPASARTPPQMWGSPAAGPPSFTGGYGGMRGLGSRTVSYQSMASSSDYGWGSASEAGGAHGAFTGGGHTALDMNGRIDD